MDLISILNTNPDFEQGMHLSQAERDMRVNYVTKYSLVDKFNDLVAGDADWRKFAEKAEQEGTPIEVLWEIPRKKVLKAFPGQYTPDVFLRICGGKVPYIKIIYVP